MKKTICNKLIRDNIPEIIEKSGKECDVKVLDDEEVLNTINDLQSIYIYLFLNYLTT